MKKLKFGRSLVFTVTVISVIMTSSCSNKTINTQGKLTSELMEKKICFIAGLPSKEITYKVIKRIKYGKGSYGKVDEVTGELADQARVIGADAIINYEGSQRFGFWPWRLVRPIVRGDAIKWNDGQNINCEQLGGVLH